jgi:hypothetical protein
VGRGAGVLFAAFDHEKGSVPPEAAQFVGESGDESILLVKGQTRDPHGLLRKELSHKKAQKAQKAFENPRSG